jgi:tRNA uridine 5-carboxymethylaminomethyl modification enzyme
LNEIKIKPEKGVLVKLKELGTAPIKNVTSLAQLLRRNEVFLEDLRAFDNELVSVEAGIGEEVETRIKYEGYIKRQEQQVEKMRNMENTKIPDELDYEKVYGLTKEVREKLGSVRPLSLGQASRISGVTPAAIMALRVHFKKYGHAA